MTLPPRMKKVIQPSGSQLVNYNYVDVADGKGIIVFYGASTNSDGVTINDFSSGAYALTTSPIYSNDIVAKHLATTVAAGNIEKQQDVDFDATFNLPRVIDGTAYIIVGHGVDNNDAGDSITNFMQARIKHVTAGGTETELAVASGAGIITVGSTTDSQTVCLKLDVPNTEFAAGQTLRVTMEQWIENIAATGSFISFGMDPQARADPNSIISASDLTKLECHIPFVFDI